MNKRGGRRKTERRTQGRGRQAEAVAMDVQTAPFEERFRRLYQLLLENHVILVAKDGEIKLGRQKVFWTDKEGSAIVNQGGKLIRRAINEGANYLPFKYQEAYVTPLKNNLELIITQTQSPQDNPNFSFNLEYLIGAVYDLADPSMDEDGYEDLGSDYPHRNLSNQIRQFNAVISNFYRAFLAAAVRQRANLKIKDLLPPLATFQYQSTLDDPTASMLTADEANLLFGSSVGVVVLPSSFRTHPVLWGTLAHEVGGHDVIHADKGLVQELQDGVFDLFAKLPYETPETREFLGQLWRYWINEAAADIYGVLNMGPAFALCTAVYTAALNKELIPSIQQSIRVGAAAARNAQAEKNAGVRISALAARSLEMNATPILDASPPDRPMGDIDTHPSDLLRLYMMIGVIDNLRRLPPATKKNYIEMIERVIALCTTDDRGDRREDIVKIRGYLQISSDIWITVAEKGDEGNPDPRPRQFPLDRMKEYAREVGRYVVTEPLEALHGLSIQDLVTWDEDHEVIATNIKDKLLRQAETEGSICNMGDDAQLLAGTVLADLENPDLYSMVNERLAEALQNSFDRDEVWGTPVLARVWSAPPEIS